MIVLHQKSHPPLYAATKLKRCPSIIDPRNSKDWQVGGPASQNKAQDSLKFNLQSLLERQNAYFSAFMIFKYTSNNARQSHKDTNSEQKKRSFSVLKMPKIEGNNK